MAKYIFRIEKKTLFTEMTKTSKNQLTKLSDSPEGRYVLLVKGSKLITSSKKKRQTEQMTTMPNIQKIEKADEWTIERTNY